MLPPPQNCPLLLEKLIYLIDMQNREVGSAIARRNSSLEFPLVAYSGRSGTVALLAVLSGTWDSMNTLFKAIASSPNIMLEHLTAAIN